MEICCCAQLEEAGVLRGAHAELRGWVLELFELQQTEATRAMLLMQLECERRLEGVSAAQAAVADAQAEKQSLDELRTIVADLEAAKEAEVASVHGQFESEQQSLNAALELAAHELESERLRAAELAERVDEADARAADAEAAAVEALQLAADAEKIVAETRESEAQAMAQAEETVAAAKRAEADAKADSAAAEVAAEEAGAARRLAEVEADVEAEVASAATAEGRVVLGQVHELANEIGTFLERQRVFEEQRAAEPEADALPMLPQQPRRYP